MSWIQDEIIKTIQTYVDGIVDKLKYDKTIMGKVVSINGGNAVVEITGDSQSCRIKAGIDISAGDVVLVKIPNNNKNLKYIDGKLL